MKLHEALAVLRDYEAEIRGHHVKSLSIFGSVARDEARDDSDIDILVEFDRRVGLLAFVGLKLFLESILERPVDLVTVSGLRSSMRESVLKEAKVVVQDAEANRRSPEAPDRAEAIQGIRAGLESMQRGEGRPARAVLDELRRKRDIPSDV